MKKLSLYVFLVLMFCNIGFAEEKKKLPVSMTDYHSTSLNENLVNYGWKIKSVRKTNNFDIYILNKDSWILYCTVEIGYLESDCYLP